MIFTISPSLFRDNYVLRQVTVVLLIFSWLIISDFFSILSESLYITRKFRYLSVQSYSYIQKIDLHRHSLSIRSLRVTLNNFITIVDIIYFLYHNYYWMIYMIFIIQMDIPKVTPTIYKRNYQAIRSNNGKKVGSSIIVIVISVGITFWAILLWQ